MGILRDARAAQLPMPEVGRALVRAQPSMAPVWNVVLETLAADAERFERFVARLARGRDALRRFAIEALTAQGGSAPLRLVTLSASASVMSAVEAVHAVRPVRLACSESRPALEGRRLAARVAHAGIPVTCFGDAAIAHALAGADAVVVGADAVSPDWFLNKSGTRMLAAAAAQQGVPLYVLATCDKFVSRAVAAHLEIREGSPTEIWRRAPPGVEVRNPYFEPTPLDLVASLVNDAGILGSATVADACDPSRDALLPLLGPGP